MTHNYQIRRALPADAAMIATLGARLFAEAYGPTHPEPDLTPYLEASFRVADFAEKLTDPEVVILLVESQAGESVGYAHLSTSDAPLPEGVGGRRATEVVRFYLDQRWQGQGVADALMTACFSATAEAGADRTFLQVWQQAPRPIAFYHRMGFQVTGTATFRFGPRVDTDFLMVRLL